jgi:hypothetical protein
VGGAEVGVGDALERLALAHHVAHRAAARQPLVAANDLVGVVALERDVAVLGVDQVEVFGNGDVGPVDDVCIGVSAL